jgi:hypothetical protein
MNGDNIMNFRRFVGVAAIGVAAPIVLTVVSPLADADPPAPGDPCTVWHATTKDAAGATMWCNAMMTGTHNLVWQYGGPA